MHKASILVVEDEDDILELVTYNLSKEGFRVDAARSGEEGLKKIRAQRADLVLLDIMLPGVDGLAVCRAMKSTPELSGIPIVMMTARSEEADVVTGLELGADDYITKPFSPRVLLARIKSVLRRHAEAPEQEKRNITVHGVTINPIRHEVQVEGRSVELTVTEFRVLQFLANRPGWVFTRSQIVEAVRGDDYPVTDRSVDVQIVGLRRKLGDAGQYVETVRGVGYRFKG